MFQGQVWQYYAPNDIAQVESWLSTTADAPVITFESATIPTFTGSGSETVYSLLGSPATGFSGSTTKLFPSSVFLITGFIDLLAGDHSFAMATNDGFKLTIGGTDVLSSNSQGNFGSTSSVTGGVMAFRLLYWNNATEGRLVLTIDGESASAAAAPGAEVPLPAAGLLLVTALGGLGGVSAFRRRAA